MNEVYQFFSNYTEPTSIRVVLLSLLLALGLAQAVAATYVFTFRGMSYSRSFVMAMAMGGTIAATVMLAINNSIAAGLGIAGSLAIIRFRSELRDPRDMVFMFAAMATGIASGLRMYLAAVLGAAVFCVAAVVFTAADFGSQRRFDGLLRLQLPLDADEALIAPVLRQHLRYFALVSLREAAQGRMMERAYQVQLAEGARRGQLVHQLESLDGVQGVSLLLQEPTVEL